jgi:cyclophilin family peptidyl-prolyl cis-trans isomerase
MSETTAAGDTLHLELKSGRVVIQLRPDLAPKHVERVKQLCAEGGSNLPDLPAEFTRSAKFVRGTVGAARTGNPNSANSQFYIMFAPAPHLDGQYSIWGQVTEGMEHIDGLKRGEGAGGTVRNPDRIVTMKVA